MKKVTTPEFCKPITTLQDILAFLWQGVQEIPGQAFWIENMKADFQEFAKNGGVLKFGYCFTEDHDPRDAFITLVVTGRTEIPITRNGREIRALDIEAGVITKETNYVPSYARRFAELHLRVANLAVDISERTRKFLPLEPVDPSKGLT